MLPAAAASHDSGMKTLRPLLPLLLLALVFPWLGGCNTIVDRAGVALSLAEVAVGADNRAVITLRLQNENIVPLAVSSTRTKVAINGVNYGEAVGEKPIALTENGGARHEAVLKLANAEAAQRLSAALAAGPVAYELDCRLICEVEENKLILTSKAKGQYTRP